MNNIKETMAYGQEKLEKAGKDGAAFDARVLLSFVMDIPFREMPLHYGDDVTDDQVQGFGELIERRLAGEPLQYITNEQEFMGLSFYVDERVLIPRLDTEILAEEAAQYVKSLEDKNKKQVKVLDLCCGSGAIGLSIAKLTENAEVTLSDVSWDALEVARINAVELGVDGRVRFVESDLFEEIGEDDFDLIVSNPPYIPSDVISTLDTEVRDHEPMLALDGGDDGLDVYRRIIEEAPLHMKNGGCLMMEIGCDQADDIRELVKAGGKFAEVTIRKDLAGLDRVAMMKTGRCSN